jgi:hypothetical protein
MSYSQKMFYDAVEKVKQMFYNGSTTDEIAVETNMSLLIVEGIIDRYVRPKYTEQQKHSGSED